MKILFDQYNRKIDYLRVSVTDRCNLRCMYCMSMQGVSYKEPAEILTFEEIYDVVSAAVSLGIDKIRVTGGEPLVRKDIVKLIQSLSKIPGISDLSLTTNGVFLERYAKNLKDAGLGRINISLDTLDEKKFLYITRGQAQLSDVLNGIDKAKELGFFVKLNVVAMQGINTEEIPDFMRFGIAKGLIVRFIEFMPLGDRDFWKKDSYICMDEIIKIAGSTAKLEPVEGIRGNGPAKYFHLVKSGLVVGFIPALSCKFCNKCNRLRLTADGFLVPCLASNNRLDLKSFLRNRHTFKEIPSLIKKAVYFKPKEHAMGSADLSAECIMSKIGG